MASKKIIALILSTSIIVGFSQEAKKVFAAEVNAIEVKDNKLSEEVAINKYVLNSLDNYSEYKAKYKVKGIKSYSNNGGQYSSSSLKKAFDGDLKTHWETGKPNKLNYKNEVIVTFDNLETIDKIVYAVRQDNGYKGFSNKFSVYSSKEEYGNDFKLVAKGTATTTREIVEFKFKATEFKRLKFVFDKAHDDWASASEFMFFKPDTTLDNITNLFSDRAMTKVKDEYASKEKIESFYKNIENHPLKEWLKLNLDLAKNIIDGNVNFEGRIFKLPQMGDIAGHANDNLKFNYGTNLISTGILAVPDEIISVYVEADESKPLPMIAFSQHNAHYNYWIKTYNLQPGINKIKVPKIHSSSWDVPTNEGGAVYLINPYTKENQPNAPIVRIEGGKTFPVFNKAGDKDKFLRDLRTYKEELDNDTENKMVDIFEIVGDKFMFTGTTRGAYNVYIRDNVNPQETIDFWDKDVQKMLEFAGLDGSSYLHDGSKLRGTIRLMQPFGAMYAAGNHIGVQRDMMEAYLRPNVMKKSIWGIAHETGHQLDIGERTWGEVTNNMWANYMNISHIGYKAGDRINYDKIYPNVAPDERSKTGFEKFGLFEKLGMFWQLQLYNENYWQNLQKLYRERKPEVKTYEKKKDLLVEYSSEVLNVDLSEYFDRYLFDFSDSTREKISKLPKIDKKIWYLNSKAFNYKGNGFESKVVPSITEITKTNKGYNLAFDVNEDSKKDLLGYEVLRDGKVIAFTRTNKFIDNNAQENQNYLYEVRAVDLKLNISDKVGISSFTPKLITKSGNITLKMHEQFNSSKYVSGLSHNFEDITDRIKIKYNNVDTSKKGSYEIVYELTDLGYTVTKTINVNVVSDYEYISDIEATSTKVGWRSLQKDKSPTGTPIKLYRNGTSISHDKGIGVHASSEVIYNIDGKGYDNFESYIGIDQSVKGSRASATFEVWVDGEKKYGSGVFRHNTEQEFINIPVTGAKEVKLITTDAKINGNESDHTIWAGAKFTQNSSKPKLQIPESTSIKVGETIDIKGSYLASDVEDGDLTNSVEVRGTVNFNRVGNYDITYIVKDSDGNITTKTRSIAVVNMDDFKYLTDYDWKLARTSYGNIKKDKSPSGNKIRLTEENNKEVIYERGLGSHATANIVYDLTDKDYKYFTSYVGVDRAMYGTVGSISFQVWVDGKMKYDSGLMNSRDSKKYVEVPINNAKELKLVVTDGGNGIGSDHGVWGNTKLHYISSERVDKISLEEKVNEISGLKDYVYTKASWDSLVESLNKANEVIKKENSTQEEIDNLVVEINEKKNTLLEREDKKQLKVLLDEANAKDESLYEPVSWNSFLRIKSIVNGIYEDINASEKDIQDVLFSFKIYMADLVYKIDRSKLENAIKSAEDIKRNEYTAGSFENVDRELSIAKYIISKNNSTQSSINSSVERLENAIKKLVKIVS